MSHRAGGENVQIGSRKMKERENVSCPRAPRNGYSAGRIQDTEIGNDDKIDRNNGGELCEVN